MQFRTMLRIFAPFAPFAAFAALASMGLLLGWVAGAGAQGNIDAPNEPTHHIEDGDTDIDSAERDRDARDKFNRGREAYEHGEYRDAWDYFRQAYVLSRRPALLYNVGQSADRLGLDDEALKAFRMYLRDAPEAENRREVENRVRALERRVQQRREGQDASGAAIEPADGEAGEAGGEGEAGESAEVSEADLLAGPPAAAQPSRDGWYFRGMLGVSYLLDSASGGVAEHTISGGGVALDAAVGHVVTPNIVLGGVMMLSLHGAPTRDDGTELEHANLVLFGPFIDYYPAPLTGNWHFHGALAIGQLGMKRSAVEGDTIGNSDAGAGAVVVGANYEWPMWPEIGVGVGGRLTFASATQGEEISHAIIVPAVGATATWY